MAVYETGKTSIEEVNRIKDRIASLVEQKFAAGASIYYLSQLGNDLGKDRIALENFSHKKLADFINNEFSYDIGITGQHQNILYIKRDGDAACPIESAPRPLYDRSFWAAFAVPLSQGERRLINTETKIFGPDEDRLRETGGEVREIDASYVVGPDESERSQRIAEQVKRWLTDQGLEGTLFLAQPKRGFRAAVKSPLELIFEALDRDQLRRISLPLDIVKALNTRPVRRS